MEEKAKIQIGDIVLDGVIEVEMKQATEHYANEIREAVKNMRAQLMQSFRVTMNFNRPEDSDEVVTPRYDNVVEGSIAEGTIHPEDQQPQPFALTKAYMAKYPWRDAVEGSITELITDPTQLLESDTP